MEQDALSPPILHVELGVTWAEFAALTSAPEDGSGAALLNTARTFLAPSEVEQLLRHHRAHTPIHVVAHHEVPAPRIRAARA
ncbi:MAG: hypothetical protein ACLQVI_24845 [Polyangiaceae bacterium]